MMSRKQKLHDTMCKTYARETNDWVKPGSSYTHSV